MIKINMVFVFIALVSIPMASAYETGNTPIRLTVNPCSVFGTEAACTSAGCNWCNGVCQSADCVTSAGTPASDKFNITITIQNADYITNIGDLKFSIYLENNNSYLVKGTLWTWIENNGEYHKQNMTVFCPAMSNKTIKFKTFLMLLPGKYELKAELLRDPTRIRDYAQLGFEAKSVTGFASTGLKLEPTEAILIMILIIMIVMVAFAILLFVTDFYKYLFSEPAPKQE